LRPVVEMQEGTRKRGDVWITPLPGKQKNQKEEGGFSVSRGGGNPVHFRTRGRGGGRALIIFWRGRESNLAPQAHMGEKEDLLMKSREERG